jgi:hypothetical protein
VHILCDLGLGNFSLDEFSSLETDCWNPDTLSGGHYLAGQTSCSLLDVTKSERSAELELLGWKPLYIYVVHPCTRSHDIGLEVPRPFCDTGLTTH